jgi:hypothetical protein
MRCFEILRDRPWEEAYGVISAHCENEFLGALSLQELANGWIEIGPVAVLSEHRQRAYTHSEFGQITVARSLVRIAKQLVCGQKTFWCSHNSKMVHLFRTECPYFQEVALWDLPLAVQWRNLSLVCHPASIAHYLRCSIKPKQVLQSENAYRLPRDIFAICREKDWPAVP